MKIGKRIAGTLSLPLLTILIAVVLSLIHGVVLFDGHQTWLVFTRALVSVSIVTFALSINLSSGRFDFSIGAISLLSNVITLKLATALGLGVIPTVLLSVFVGCALGLFSGFLYVITKLPAIIISLGVTLLYEGVAYTITEGHGVSIVTNDVLMNSKTIPFYLIIGVIVLALMIFVFDHLKFGYDYKALQSGQKIAVNTGINEVANALICYSISGALMGLYGFISATTNGVVSMSLNFGSISPMFVAFLPMFIGSFIGNYSNDKLGYVIGGFVSAMISVMYLRFNVSSSTQQIITALVLVGFLIYLNNQGLIKKVINAMLSRFQSKEEKKNDAV